MRDRTLIRRWLLLMSLMLWQGGFMFYGAVVVPIGTAELASDASQGFITRRVTWYLNLAGVVALAAWAWDSLAGGSAHRPRLRRALWAAAAAMMAGLLWLHGALDDRLDPATKTVLDRPAFARLHIAYLLTSTAQWAAAVGLLLLTLAAWRHDDRR